MKKFYALFLVLIVGSLLAACSASTANISGADLGTGYDSSANKVTGATTTFSKTEPVLHNVISVSNAPDGTTVRIVWTVVAGVDASGNAANDTKLNEVTKTLSSDGTIDATLTIPSSGQWPTGSYKSDIYLNDKLDRTLTFTVQ